MKLFHRNFVYFSNVKDASRLFGAGVTFYLFKNRSSRAGVLLPTSKADRFPSISAVWMENFSNFEALVITAIGNFCICSIAIGLVIEIIVIYGIHHRGNHVGIDKLLVSLIGGIPISMPTILYYKLTVDKSQEYDRVPSLLPPHTSSPPAYLDLYGKL
ncbi:uncharacterized protein LOC142632304 isoform X2 [Castanea sativa]|uniref:uncharacterized protein LOC142632304 isoform X2 n=1 Tax=Castanea sativa TaxID=21020 RepID=UPI003F64C920